jgi:ribonucleoside-diphosphate reductase alpha chain
MVSAVNTTPASIPGLNSDAGICPSEDPFSTCTWVKRDTWVKDYKTGAVIFEQKDVECPEHWSQEACNVLASKYFFGRPGTPERETSVRAVIHRIARTVADWGQSAGHFDQNMTREWFYRDLAYLLLHQYAAFNSPVWFNLGLFHVHGHEGGGGSVGYWFDPQKNQVVPVDPMTRPPCSACFILKLEDSIDSIWNTAHDSAALFKYGSGVGMDLSPLRSRLEPLSGGGLASGPLSFGDLIDTTGGTIKSGGRCLAPGTFVYTTQGPRAVETLLDVPFEVLSYDPPANRYKVKSAQAWKSGIKSVVKITTDKGEFRLSSDHPVRLSTGNYCRAGELRAGQSLFSCAIHEYDRGYTMVSLKDGRKGKELLHRMVATDILGADIAGLAVHHRDNDRHNNHSSNLEVLPQAEHARVHNQEQVAHGTHVFQTTKFPRSGCLNGMHANAGFWQNADKVEAYKAKQSQILKDAEGRAAQMAAQSVYQRYLNTGYHLIEAGENIENEENFFRAYEKVIGRIDSKKRRRKAFVKQFGSYEGFLAELGVNNHRVVSVESCGQCEVYSVEVDCPTADDKTAATGHNFVIWPSSNPYGSGVCVSNTRRAAIMLTIKDRHPEFSDFIGIKRREELKAKALIAAGYPADFNGEAYSTVGFQNANLSVRLSNDFLRSSVAGSKWQTFWVTDPKQPGPTLDASACLDDIADATWECGDPGVQFEDTIQEYHTCPNSGAINSSNPCSEYMFLDDTACNLASLRLTRFCQDGAFDTELFCRSVRVVFRAMEILVGEVSYPTARVAANSARYRPLGLGYADLGGLLMSTGLPYDSDNARAVCGAITALMTGEAYRTSAYMAEKLGAFDGYSENRVAMLRVMDKHRCAVEPLRFQFTAFNQGLIDAASEAWNDAIARGLISGFRNAQASVLAPTGCVTADTHLLTSEGLLPITELGDKNGPKWQDHSFLVSQEGKPQQSTRFFVNGVDRVFELRTKAGHRIRATWKHRLRVIDQDGCYVWRRMKDMVAGDTVVLRLGGHEELLENKDYVRISSDSPLGLNLPEFLDEQTAEVLGFYTGNGYTKKRGGLHLVVCDLDPDVDRKIASWADRLGLVVTGEPRQGCHIINLNSYDLAPWFKSNNWSKPPGNRGEGAAGAFVPVSVLRSRSSVLAAYLRGLFTADGTVSINRRGTPTVELSTVSEKLAEQVQLCLESLGIAARLSSRQPNKGSLGKRRKYRVSIAHVAAAAVFASKIGFCSQRKTEALQSALCLSPSCVSSGARLVSSPLLAELYQKSTGLPNKVRQNILVRKSQGSANTAWLRQQLSDYPQLQCSRVAELLSTGNLQFQSVVSCLELEPEATWDIEVPVRNTYLANGFVSHNTIGFVMDCATTGIEPELGLVKYKALAGGGNMKLINPLVPSALRALDYSEKEIAQVLEYVDQHGRVDGCPAMHDEDLAVFDTSLGAPGSKRVLSWRAHVDMMAAAQPFLSGAISKTINMPDDCTREEIREAILHAWRQRLKAVAIYRDGSKWSQPLSITEDKAEQPTLVFGQRRKLPRTREAFTHHFRVGGHDGYVTPGLYDDDTLGEIFIKMNKEGSTVAGLMDTIGILTSLGLQYGVPVEVLVDKLSYLDFEPRGMTDNPQVPTARSVVDYVFRWLGQQFSGAGARAERRAESRAESNGLSAPKQSSKNSQASQDTVTGPPCSSCGSMMIRTGPCFSCRACGNSTGGCG